MASLWRRGAAATKTSSTAFSEVLSYLIQPQLQSFLFKGLKLTSDEVEEGATQAVAAVYAHRNSGDGSPRLIDMVEAKLCSRMAAADCAEWPRPQLLSIEGAALDRVRLIIGGQGGGGGAGVNAASAEDAKDAGFFATKTVSAEDPVSQNAISPVTVGNDLVILSRTADFQGVPDIFRKMLLLDYTEQYLHSLMIDHGMTMQLIVDVDLVLAAPPASKLKEESESETETNESGEQIQKCSQRWVFESAMDARFKQDLDWRVVDVNGTMDGAEFWNELVTYDVGHESVGEETMK